jgi:hypothetical protein
MAQAVGVVSVNLETQPPCQRQAYHGVAVRLLVLRAWRTKGRWLKQYQQVQSQKQTKVAKEDSLPQPPLGYPALRCQGADSLCGAYSGEAVVKY